MKYFLIYCRPIIADFVGCHMTGFKITCRPVSQYQRPREVALASSACVDKTAKIIPEFTRKDPFLHLKRTN